MAASLDLSKLSFIFIILACTFNSCLCQNATANTTIGTTVPVVNTTTATTTTPAPTTTTIPTTTTSTIAPSVPGTVIPENTDVSKCPCDLTGLACDVNCCCDPDCSDRDKSAFSQCLLNSYRLDDKLCFDRDVFLYESGPAFSNTTDDLFCIYFDNEEERNYYVNPSLVTTEAQFLQYANEYAEFTFQPSSPPTPAAQLDNFYRSGDPMYIVFPSQAFSYLALPAALSTSSACAYGNPAAYLTDQTNECVQTVADLQTDCETEAAFIASNFYEGMRVVRDPYLLKYFNSSDTVDDPLLGTLDLSSITQLYDNSLTLPIELDATDPLQCMDSNGAIATCPFSAPPASPTFNQISGFCENVLTRVHYRFVTSGSFLQNVTVQFIYSDIDTASLTQTYSSSFTTATQTDNSFKRSGRPGYLVGEPILAGNLTETVVNGVTEQKIELNRERGQQLALIRPSVTGDCLTQAGQLRESVVFGQDMRSGCFIQVALQNNDNDCQLLNDAIITAVEGYPPPAFTNGNYEKNYRYVSTFGDSDVFRTGDWIEILYLNRPSPPATSTGQCLLSLGMDIQIVYANVGSLPNPQPKIIGVAFVYDEPQPLDYRCSGPFCQPSSSSDSQRIEISSSVTFIDGSNPPEGVEGKYPTFAVRLPYDFFYPFLNSASTVNLDCGFIVLVTTLLSVIRFWCDIS